MRANLAFWTVTASITAIVLGSNTPLPLFTLYQSAWHFSTSMLTAVYGIYTAGVIVAVFLFGPASDTVGRKTVLLPAIGSMAAGLITCMVAPNVLILMAGRVLQGLAIGAGVTTAIAALGELHPDPNDHGNIALTVTVATVAGLAGGPLVAGSLAEFGPTPMVTPYLAALLLVVVVFVGVTFVPETVAHRTTFHLHLAAIRIPPAIMPPFLLATFVEAIAYAVAGTFAGLGASFTRDLMHMPNHLAAGLVVALLFGCSGAAQHAARRWPFRRTMIAGLVVLLFGLFLFALAVARANAVYYFLSALVFGAGHGLAYLGSQELTGRIAPPDRRAEVFSGFQLGLFVGATVPAIGIGFAARVIGLSNATFIFVVMVAALILSALTWIGGRWSPVMPQI